MTITATSKSSSYKLYKTEVNRKHYYSHATLDMDADSAILKNDSTEVFSALPRDCKDVTSDYVTKAIAYNSTSEITGVQDNCTLTIYQRDK